jgi:hypothetical protein
MALPNESSGQVKPVILVDTDGIPYVASGGGGGGGDASAANQVLEIAELEDINTQTAAIQAAVEATLDVDTGLAQGVQASDLAFNSGNTDPSTQRVVLATDVALPAGENFLGVMGGVTANPTANFTRPADTTAYASGDLVANSTTAGSVVAMSLTCARVAAGSFILRKIKLHKSGTGVTNASFRVHFFRAAPGTVTNGDNGVFSVSGVADYLGAMDVTIDRAFTDGAVGFGVPVIGSEMSVKLASGTTIAALIEARGAYTPVSSEVFTLTLEDLQD